MKALLFYRPKSEHEPEVREYLREFKFRTGKELPTIDVDSREGIQLAEVHEVMKYPTILALDDQGREQQRWDGEMLPQIAEVSYYLTDQKR